MGAACFISQCEASSAQNAGTRRVQASQQDARVIAAPASSGGLYHAPQIRARADAAKKRLNSGMFDWRCSRCGHPNYGYRQRCRMHGYKPADASRQSCAGEQPPRKTEDWEENLAIVRRVEPNYGEKWEK